SLSRRFRCFKSRDLILNFGGDFVVFVLSANNTNARDHQSDAKNGGQPNHCAVSPFAWLGSGIELHWNQVYQATAEGSIPFICSPFPPVCAGSMPRSFSGYAPPPFPLPSAIPLP